MTETPAESYIRGAGVSGADGRRLFVVVASVILAGMVAVTAYLFASAASTNNTAENLARSGMTVTATITGCTGISDGVGMGIEYYDCTAQVSAGGQSYQGLLHGNRVTRAIGSRVQAIMVPGEISTLTLDRSRTSSYVPGSVMAVVCLVCLVGLLLFVRRRRAQPARP